MSKRIVLLLTPFVLSLLMVGLVITAVTTPTTHAATDNDPSIHVLPSCTNSTEAQITILGAEWPTNYHIAIYWNNSLKTQYLSNEHIGSFTFQFQENGLTPQTYEIRAVSQNGVSATATFQVPCAPEAMPIPDGTWILTDRYDGSGYFGSNALSIYGPNTCSSFGDPFSPLNPNWPATSWLTPTDFTGYHTYQYRIRIPADYPEETLRVEIMDPDSILQPNPAGSMYFTTTVTHTQIGIDAGLPITEELSCRNASVHSCMINTGEIETLALPYDEVNPYWFVRIDENRFGNGSGGGCGVPGNYSPQFNTQSLFQLYYLQQTTTETKRIDLAHYTGQVGDNMRDAGEHDTDLRWVSPGASNSYDQAVFVPADSGSTGSFEINLNEAVPGIITDTETGDRLLYLDVSSVSGSSENNFALWAGPPTYIEEVPSDVNLRNVYLINNPGAHDDLDVTVEALDYMQSEFMFNPQNYNENNPIEFPLIQIGPEYAGQTVRISTFDSDAGTQAPVVFHMDSLAFTSDDSADRIDPTKTDWAKSFGGNESPIETCFYNDPNNVLCQNLWIDPQFEITLPTDSNCDFNNPTPDTCTPFYGGTFMALYDGGLNDNYTWHVEKPETPAWDNTFSCTAFPILVHADSRSVQPPDATTNAFPVGLFTYPNQEPIYGSYALRHHQPNIELKQAKSGALYKVELGSGLASYNWGVWNQSIGDSATTLAASLTWPGNSADYVTLVNGRFPGYQEPDNPTDQTLQIENWILANSNHTDDPAILAILNNHIDLGRLLRLPVTSQTYTVGDENHAQVSRFGLFRILGYNLNPTDDTPWLLLEFQRWNDSCGQLADAPVPLDSVTIQPEPEIVGNVVTITAVTTPYTATRPITYTWQTSNQTISHTTGFTDTASFTLPYSGTQTIIVTATNGVGQPVTDTLDITIEPLRIYLPFVTTSTCEHHTATLNLEVKPTTVFVNDTITMTTTLENIGCLNLGHTEMRLTATPDLIFPANFIMTKLDLEGGTVLQPGESWTKISTATAVSPGTFTLNANASFEVHIDYPWPAYWGLEEASKEITIIP